MVPQALRMAENAFKRYKTRDLDEIIEKRHIRLREFESPESLLGFFTVMNRRQVIGINSSADDVQRRTGLMHEIGHSLNDYRTAASGGRFDDDFKFFSMSNAPCEFNANLTGADLFISDEFILERIHYRDYKRLMAYVNEMMGKYRKMRDKVQFEEAQMQEFYDCHTDIPSYEQLSGELGIDVGMVKFKFKALGFKGYEIPNLPETQSDFLKNWQRDYY